jgi:hypothetical protein
MRWGEPNRLPPLRRGRGLMAAALLAVGLVAAYAILAVLSLTSVAPSFLAGVPTTLGGLVRPEPAPAVLPSVNNLVNPQRGPSLAPAALSELAVDFGTSTSGTSLPNAIKLHNTALTPIDVSLDVLGAPGVAATFPDSQPTAHLPVGMKTHISLSTTPLHAGSLNGGRLRISISGAAPLYVPLSGAQAPLPPSSVTATPEAGGAVHVTWPASPSTGVAGYEVERSVAGGTWQPVDASATAAGIVDETGADGESVHYRVRAITAGVSPTLPSAASPTAGAVTDAAPPDAPANVVIKPGYVNLANENAVPVEVDLPPTSSPTDVVSVTLTNGSGDSATATGAGGQSPLVLTVDASKLPEGTLQSTVTLTDAVGNTTGALPIGGSVLKDTVAPAPPDAVNGPEVVNAVEASSVPFWARIADPESNERIHVQLTDGQTTADGASDVSDSSTRVTVDASHLDDGPLTISAWTVDEAGNQSGPVDEGTLTKDSTAPESASGIRVPAGEQSPAGYVNAASASAVTVVARFPQPTDAADDVVVTVGSQHIQLQGGLDTYVVGPLDLSERPDGPVPLAITVTDPAGNSSTTKDTATKDTVAPAPPSSFTVPEGEENAEGFVNSATASAAIIQATFPDGTEATDTLTASVNGIDLGTRVGGSIAVAWRGDLSQLPDGPLDLDGTITDAAGNTTDFGGHAVKETKPPPPPVAAHVIGSCRPDVITPSTAPNVSVQVVLPDLPGLSGQVTVTLTDSAGHTATGSAYGGPGIVVVQGIDASSFVPGHVSVVVSIADTAGNTSTFDGTPAQMVVSSGGCGNNGDGGGNTGDE